MTYHPEYVELIQNIERVNLYKYAAYRMALKVRKVQKACKFDLVDLNAVDTIFEDREWSSIQSLLTVANLRNLLLGLYDILKRQIGLLFDSSKLADVSLCFIQSVFAGKASCCFHVYQMKFILALFCSASLHEKQKYIYNMFAVNGQLTEGNLQLLLECFAKTSEALGEKLSFGCHLLQASVENCLKFGQEQGKVSEKRFFDWLALEPQTLVWLSTFYRLSVSEKYEHRAKCNICRTFPILGMRYKCLLCINYNTCQECFLRGFVSRSHQRKHPVQEFCYPASRCEEIKASLMVIKNNLLLRSTSRETFLVFPETYNNEARQSVSFSKADHSESSLLLKYSHSIPVAKELFSIISKLEDENRRKQDEVKRIEAGIESSCGGMVPTEEYKRWLHVTEKVLQDHSHHLHLQMQRLKEILQGICHPVPAEVVKKEMGIVSPQPQVSTCAPGVYFESTPLAATCGNASSQSPQNLSKFIRWRAKIDGITDLSKTVKNSMQKNAMYSVADIEMGDFSCTDSPLPNNIKEMSETIPVGSVLIYKGDDEQPEQYESADDSSGISSKLSSAESSEVNSGSSATQPSQNSSCAPQDSSLGFISPSVSDHSGNNTACKEKSSVENVETELQQILDHLEDLYPKVTDLQRSIPEQKDKFLSALSEMEEALKRLSTTVIDDFSTCHL